ncbi:hypothetical protein PCA31118_05135 [Pandoraea captiosa]|uniref:Uncharacterized protein n=1 Tax=Pandoraea captiosa TaxID=2508302 RepID=A0A5E5AQT3_9BURK|nr:hypothetical protein PCA31118_05135 [Pandoraea captiosa]
MRRQARAREDRGIALSTERGETAPVAMRDPAAVPVANTTLGGEAATLTTRAIAAVSALATYLASTQRPF